MARFKKRIATSQEIPTSAMPDIIFILLFFFMVATTVREEKEDLVDFSKPEATQIHELNKSLTRFHIYIGPPKDSDKYGSAPRIQMNGALVSPSQIPQIINTNIENLKQGSKSKSKIHIVLTVDENAKEGIVTDVEEQLKLVRTRNIVYSATQYTTGQ